MGWVGNGSNFVASGTLEGWGTCSAGVKGAARLRALEASSTSEMSAASVSRSLSLSSSSISDSSGSSTCCSGSTTFSVAVKFALWLLSHYSGL